MLLLSRALRSSFVLAWSLLPAQSIRHPGNEAQGIFQGSTDIGSPFPGHSEFDPLTKSYRVRGSGDDVWGTADHFRLTWTRVSGDGALAADVHIDAPVAHPLAKGMLMFRQSLDPGSPYADIAIHADGHITLQYRQSQGGPTKDVVLPERQAPRLRIVRHGNTYTVYAMPGGKHAAPSITVPMQDPVYVGIGVCSHNAYDVQTVTFSHVDVEGAVAK